MKARGPEHKASWAAIEREAAALAKDKETNPRQAAVTLELVREIRKHCSK